MPDEFNYKEMSKEVRAVIREELQPITDRVDGHNRTLYGATGSNGLVGDVTRIKTTGKVIAGIAGFAGLIWGALAALGRWIRDGIAG